ncbi:protein takeout [Odontomachus brunneus]|uniref:protein takeout n=1 Tax=Odontomachus brunneus TaxID=486640 RepID=UPI0013F22EA8|nr:protein takeout [Odontomachus brunneus]
MALVKATLMAFAVTTILLAVATSKEVGQREIPDFLHICKMNVESRKFHQCVAQSIMKLAPYLKTGVPEYNIPSLEPLILKRLIFAPSNALRLQAKDILVYDASNFNISKLKIDLDNSYIHVDVSLPNIRIEGQYDISGKIVLLPLRGSGHFHGNVSDCTGSCRILIEKYSSSSGVEYMRIKEFKMKITVGDGMLILENLFGGDQALGDVVNSAINNNFSLFLKEILPPLEKALSDAFQITSNHIVEHFSFAQLFPNT